MTAPTSAEHVGTEPARTLSRPDAPGHGSVEAIYTYGSPAIAEPALIDRSHADHCFRGLRVYTEDILAGGTKQADDQALSDPGGAPHAKMPTLALRWDADSDYAPCPQAESEWPGG